MLRILLMLIIVAHHYVVNSGLTSLYDFDHVTKNMVFLQIAGFGGKMAINGFTLITGYFMCKTEWSWKRILKLVLTIKIYTIGIYLIFLLTGYTQFHWNEFLAATFSIVYESGWRYIGTVVCLYLLIPFANKLIHALSKRELELLLIFLIAYFTGVATAIPMRETFSLLWWMMAMYLLGAYVRLYPAAWMNGQARWCILSLASVALCWISIILIDLYGGRIGYRGWSYYFISDSNKILALTTGFSLFLFFRNLKIGCIPWINKVASAAFGVLMIHANSDLMRRFLWKDLLHCTDYFGTRRLYLHFAVSVLGIYVIGTVVELLRIRFLEKPLFRKL